MQSRKQAIDIADAAMLFVVVIWSANNVATKAVLNVRLLPMSYVFLRFGIVVLILGAFLLLRGRLARIQRADWPRLLFSAITGYALYNLLWIVGISRTSAFSAAIIVAMAPVFTLIFSAALGIEPVRGLQWLGVLLAFGGVTLFVADKVAGNAPAIGDLLNLGAAASFALFNISTRPLIQKYGALTPTFWSVLISFLVVTPFAIPTLTRQDWRVVGVPGWSAIIYAAAVSMLGGYALWGWAIARRGAGATVPFMFLIPPVTGVLAYIFLDERFSRNQIIGATLIISGVFLALDGARRAAIDNARLQALQSFNEGER